jgi:phosphatidylserine/phosphatidylglycerophosphate/cardiolipin synthase-like enzyme
MFSFAGETPALYLTSKDDVSSKFIEQVDQEERSIKMISQRMSDPEVVKALILAHKRGAFVELIVEPSTVTKNSPLLLCLENAIEVFVWQSDKVPKSKSEAKRRLHHFFTVFGSKLCWLGSYSFSLKRKYRPFESSLLFSDEKLAGQLLEEFDTIKKNYTIPLEAYLKSKELSSKR